MEVDAPASAAAAAAGGEVTVKGVKAAIKSIFNKDIGDHAARKLVNLARQTGKTVDDIAEEYEVFMINEKLENALNLNAVERFVQRMTPMKGAAGGGVLPKKGGPDLAALAKSIKPNPIYATFGMKNPTLPDTPKPMDKSGSRPPVNLPSLMTPATGAVSRIGAFKTPKPSQEQILTPAVHRTLKFAAAPPDSSKGGRGGGGTLSSVNQGLCLATVPAPTPATKPEVGFTIPEGGILDKAEETGRFRYMHSDLDHIRKHYNERILAFGELMQKRIQEKTKDDEKEDPTNDAGAEDEADGNDEFYQSVNVPWHGSVYLLGRILYETLPDGAHQFMLEGDLTHSGGNRVEIDLTGLTNYSIFPGQIVVIKGVNSSGRKVVVEEIHSDFSVPRDPSKRQAEAKDRWRGSKAPVKVLAAAGPFTASGSLAYRGSQLQKFARTVKSSNASLVVLLGPFLPEDNPALHKLDMSFADAASHLLEQFLADACTPKRPLQVICVPNSADASASCVFPQGAYEWGAKVPDPAIHEVDMISNPATFVVNDIHFAVSSYNTIFQLSRKETVRMGAGQRVHKFQRLCDHIVGQRTFCPQINGPGLERTFDKELEWEETPDVLVTLSNLQQFALRTQQGCIAMNPRSLAKSNYASVTIHPPKEGAVATKNRVGVELLKI